MIPNNIPSSLRRPGAYPEFQFVQSASLLTPIETRVVVIAEAKGGTATIEQPTQVFSETDGDAKSGVGTLGALLCRKAIETAKLIGTTPEIWLCPVAEPGGGTAMQETITVTVTTAQSGTEIINIAGRPVQVGVSAGDSANAIATAIQAAIAGIANQLPVTATVAANVVTCVHVTKGVNGNDTTFSLGQGVTGVTLAFAQSVAGAGAYDPTNALNALYDKRYHATALSNHTTTDVAKLLLDRASAWSYTQKNFRFHFLGCVATLATAQALQAAANDYGIVVASAEQCPALPGELAVAAAIAEFAQEAPNANIAGVQVPLPLPPASYAYTDAEVESALNGGVTPLTPSGSFMKIERLVTTQITLNGAPFEALRDIAYPRTAAYLAEQIDDAFLVAFQQATETDDRLDQARDVVIGVQRAAEAAGYIKNVDNHLGEIAANYVSAPAGRMVVSNPFEVAGPLFQGVFENIMYFG